MQRNLTDFQNALMSDFDKIFQCSSTSLEWTLHGETETYCYGVADEGRIQIWIYDNEAEFRSGDYHRLFERPDFGSVEQLKEDFIDVVRAKLIGV